MSDFLQDLDLFELNLDSLTLKAIAQLLDYTESFINPSQEPEAIASVYQLKNQIVQLKSQKGRSTSKIIHAGQSELRRAFHAHRNAATKTSGIASYLLLFYAAECGLKSIYLRENKLHKTDRIPDQAMLSQYGHDLSKWVAKLNIYPNKIEPAPHFHIDDGSNLDISKAHQAWRYGIKIKPKDEQNLVKWLENLCNWIKENI